jgi:uroporphyrinogen III methyltransferase/synthase
VGEALRSPLLRKRIVVTRATAQSEGLCNLLLWHGANSILFPLITIRPIEDFALLDAALRKLRPSDWIAFTSQNAVDPVVRRARMLHLDFFVEFDVQVAAVGPATQQALKFAGVDVTYPATTHDGESLARELGERVRGRTVLLPRSDIAGAELPAALGECGAEVLQVVAYRTEQTEGGRELAAMIAARTLDAIICFSPSAVHSLVAVIGKTDIASMNDSVVFAAVGETTARAFREAGVRTPLVAADATPEAVVDVLQRYFASRSRLAKGEAAGEKRP